MGGLVSRCYGVEVSKVTHVVVGNGTDPATFDFAFCSLVGLCMVSEQWLKDSISGGTFITTDDQNAPDDLHLYTSEDPSQQAMIKHLEDARFRVSLGDITLLFTGGVFSKTGMPSRKDWEFFGKLYCADIKIWSSSLKSICASQCFVVSFIERYEKLKGNPKIIADKGAQLVAPEQILKLVLVDRKVRVALVHVSVINFCC